MEKFRDVLALIPENEHDKLIQQAIEETSKSIGDAINLALPSDWGFALLIFGINEKGPDTMNYISNANREDMIVALKELIARMEGRHVEPEATEKEGTNVPS